VPTMLHQWQSYDRHIVPAHAPLVQHEECRRAFYAGAWACYQLVLAIAGEPDADECERQLEALGVEIGAITKDLRVG
jgi:hypothetical protein